MRRICSALSAIAMVTLAACHVPPATTHEGPDAGDRATANAAAGASADIATSSDLPSGPVAGGHVAGASGALATPITPAATPGGGTTSVACGNGIPEPSEKCDGNCPSSCDDGNPCTTDTLTGSTAQCSAVCVSTPVTAAKSGDQCCPPGANHASDADCPASCGDGVVDPASETCEPTSTSAPCLDSCDDSDPCTTDTLNGSTAQCNVRCTHTTLTVARGGDRCCPTGANANTDSDCSVLCGNGVVEAGETCDGHCPTSCSAAAGCALSKLVGSASRCTAECVLTRVTVAANGDGCCPDGANANNDSDCQPYCGNHVRETGETCDGDCPTHETCSWRSGCVRPVLSGAASLCTAQCEMTMITSAANRDGCCPPGANANNDDDCGAICGNGVKEPGEMCDGIDCPEADLHCKDNDPCSVDRLEGTGCDRHCAPHTRATDPCTDVPTGWNLGTISTGSCPQGFAFAGTELPEINGTTSIWCGAEHPLQCTDGDRCVDGTAPGASPILCVMKRGEQTCPAGKSGRFYANSNNPITACCGSR